MKSLDTFHDALAVTDEGSIAWVSRGFPPADIAFDRLCYSSSFSYHLIYLLVRRQATRARCRWWSFCVPAAVDHQGLCGLGMRRTVGFGKNLGRTGEAREQLSGPADDGCDG